MRNVQLITVNALGDTCPIPVVKTKQAIKELNGAGTVEILVDNEIAVQNLTKMANQKKYGVSSRQLGADKYQVILTIGAGDDTNTDDVALPESCALPAGGGRPENGAQPLNSGRPENSVPLTARKRNVVVVISSDRMGSGDDTLGSSLLKAFIYALSRQEELPQTILFYNGGARMTCEESPALEDLRAMYEDGVEILTCGTCLNFYGLTEKLKVGTVTNMYDIVEKMSGADLIVKP